MMASRNLSGRVRRRIQALEARTRYRLGFAPPRVDDVRLSAAFRHPVDAILKSASPARYRELFPESAAAELAEADRLIAHRFDLLGHPSDHGERIAWSLDPASGREWPRGFSPDIPYRGPERLGDIKLPWELNKHQYFFTLGKAAWLRGDNAGAMEIVRQIGDWIDDNPFLSGINWISALEAGSRAVSWMVAYPFYVDSIDDRFRRRLLDSLAQHCLFVERHLSHGPFANTHLAGEAAVLVVGGLFLDCSRSSQWLHQGLAILDQEIERQVTTDGVHAERSVAYHRFFLDQYYLVGALLAANGRTFSGETLARIEVMTDFLMHALFPDGTSPSFGDNDDARGLWCRSDGPADYRGLLALGAVLFNRGDFKSAARTLPEEVFWLLGEEAIAAFTALSPRQPEHGSIAYPDGGYYVMRGGWEPGDSVLVFDCGPVGFGPGGHGHADALSYQLHTAGYTFLTDSGTYSYNLDYEWRDVFRGSRAHNVVVVDRQDQSVPGDRMSWTTLAQARTRAWLTSPWLDLVDGEHDGYRRLTDPVEHRRVVVFVKPDLWVIWDSLAARERHGLELLHHVKPDCHIDLEPAAAGAVLRSPRGDRLNIWTSSDTGPGMPYDVIRGGDEERGAWFSGGYGTRVPSQALRLTSELAGHCTFLTCLSAASRGNIVTGHGAAGFHVHRTGEVQEDFWYVADGRRPEDMGDIRFDGSALLVRRSGAAASVVLATRFTDLSIEGVLTVQSSAVINELRMSDNHCAITTAGGGPAGLRVAVTGGVPVMVDGRPLRADRT